MYAYTIRTVASHTLSWVLVTSNPFAVNSGIDQGNYIPLEVLGPSHCQVHSSFLCPAGGGRCPAAAHGVGSPGPCTVQSTPGRSRRMSTPCPTSSARNPLSSPAPMLHARMYIHNNSTTHTNVWIEPSIRQISLFFGVISYVWTVQFWVDKSSRRRHKPRHLGTWMVRRRVCRASSALWSSESTETDRQTDRSSFSQFANLPPFVPSRDF